MSDKNFRAYQKGLQDGYEEGYAKAIHKPRISVVQASLLYKVTNRTIFNWIMQDDIECVDGTYDLDELQNAYDKRHP